MPFTLISCFLIIIFCILINPRAYKSSMHFCSSSRERVSHIKLWNTYDHHDNFSWCCCYNEWVDEKTSILWIPVHNAIACSNCVKHQFRNIRQWNPINLPHINNNISRIKPRFQHFLISRFGWPANWSVSISNSCNRVITKVKLFRFNRFNHSVKPIWTRSIWAHWSWVGHYK